MIQLTRSGKYLIRISAVSFLAASCVSASETPSLAGSELADAAAEEGGSNSERRASTTTGFASSPPAPLDLPTAVSTPPSAPDSSTTVKKNETPEDNRAVAVPTSGATQSCSHPMVYSKIKGMCVGVPSALEVGIAAWDEHLDLYWLPPDSNGGSPITGYEVRIRMLPSGSWETSSLLPNEIRIVRTWMGRTFAYTHLLTGLTNDVLYEVRIAARNKVGSGPEFIGSARPCPAGLYDTGDGCGILTETDETPEHSTTTSTPLPVPYCLPGEAWHEGLSNCVTKPISFPRDARIESSDRTLTVFWSVPGNDGGAPIVSYNLKWRANIDYDDDDEWITEKIILQEIWTWSLDSPPPTYSYEITELRNNTSYFVILSAENSAGRGPEDWLVGTPCPPDLVATPRSCEPVLLPQ